MDVLEWSLDLNIMKNIFSVVLAFILTGGLALSQQNQYYGKFHGDGSLLTNLPNTGTGIATNGGTGTGNVFSNATVQLGTGTGMLLYGANVEDVLPFSSNARIASYGSTAGSGPGLGFAANGTNADVMYVVSNALLPAVSSKFSIGNTNYNIGTFFGNFVIAGNYGSISNNGPSASSTGFYTDNPNSPSFVTQGDPHLQNADSHTNDDAILWIGNCSPFGSGAGFSCRIANTNPATWIGGAASGVGSAGVPWGFDNTVYPYFGVTAGNGPIGDMPGITAYITSGTPLMIGASLSVSTPSMTGQTIFQGWTNNANTPATSNFYGGWYTVQSLQSGNYSSVYFDPITGLDTFPLWQAGIFWPYPYINSNTTTHVAVTATPPIAMVVNHNNGIITMGQALNMTNVGGATSIYLSNNGTFSASSNITVGGAATFGSSTVAGSFTEFNAGGTTYYLAGTNGSLIWTNQGGAAVYIGTNAFAPTNSLTVISNNVNVWSIGTNGLTYTNGVLATYGGGSGGSANAVLTNGGQNVMYQSITVTNAGTTSGVSLLPTGVIDATGAINAGGAIIGQTLAANNVSAYNQGQGFYISGDHLATATSGRWTAQDGGGNGGIINTTYGNGVFLAQAGNVNKTLIFSNSVESPGYAYGLMSVQPMIITGTTGTFTVTVSYTNELGLTSYNAFTSSAITGPGPLYSANSVIPVTLSNGTALCISATLSGTATYDLTVDFSVHGWR